MLIKLIKFLECESHTIKQLADKLEISSLKCLEIIAKIPSDLLINCNNYYKLTSLPDWLNADEIKTNLANYQIEDYAITIISELNSTNSYIINNLDKFNSKQVVSCEFQNAGRGRLGRSWSSKIAKDLTLSILYKFPVDYKYNLLPLVVSIAINRFFKNLNTHTKIKWPNDIYLNDCKIVGILVETVLRDNQQNVVIGIGIDNVISFSRNKALAQVIKNLDDIIREYELFGFALIRREWLDNCYHCNKQIEIWHNGKLIDTGQHSDLTNDGSLMIKNKLGKLISYNNSTFSLRLV